MQLACSQSIPYTSADSSPPYFCHVQTRVRLRFHIFGHMHEGYSTSSNDVMIYINASTCNYNYNPVKPPIVFDIPLLTSA